MKITELRLRKLSSDHSPPAPASWDGPIAAVTRRAGLLKAQLGAFPCVGLCRLWEAQTLVVEQDISVSHTL